MKRSWLISAIFGVALLLFTACLWKYDAFLYNGIDLAYFNQVFWNTVHGRPFAQSIHPHLSLGDHAELAILLLAPFYALWQEPRMLLALQALAVTLPAWPLFLLAKRRTDALGPAWRFAPAAVAAAWLLNPSVHSIALFEFHILPFALFPLLMAALAYHDGARRRFLLWLLAALLVREDVALVLPFFGLLAWTERRSWWWRVAPVLLGGAWFLAAMRLIAHFSPGGGYKFRIYYDWLLHANAAEFAAHFMTLANAEMFLGFLLPLAFLPLLKPARLLLLSAPLAQILLGAPGGGELVLQTHYATLFLPALFLAAIDGLCAAPDLLRRVMPRVQADDARRGAIAALVLTAVYGTLTLGPLPHVAVRAVTTHPEAKERHLAARALINAVPADARVAASYALLPALSSREGLSSLHYWFLGVEQFATGPYQPPANIEYLAVDSLDFLVYQAQFPVTAWAAPHHAGGFERLANETGAAAFEAPPFFLYHRLREPQTRGPNDVFAGPFSALGSDAEKLGSPGCYVFALDGVRSAGLTSRSCP